MDKYNFHSDFEHYAKTTLPLNPLLLPILNKLIARSMNKFNSPEGMNVTTEVIPGYKDGTVELTIIEPGLRLKCIIPRGPFMGMI